MSARVTEPKPGEIQSVVTPIRKETVSEASPQPAAPPAVTSPTVVAAPPRKKRNVRRLVLMIAVPLLLVIGGGYFWLTGGRFVDTDNAYVQQAKVSISADIAGRITSVNVGENQVVAAGATLFTIDPQPYQIALDQANAALASARVSVAQLKVAYGTAEAQLNASQQTLAIQQASFDRKNALVKSGVNSDSTLDDVKLALQSAQNAVDLNKQQVAAAIAALGGNPDIAPEQHPAVMAAQAAVEVAQRNLSKTTVVAPAAGIVSQVSSLNVGQFVAIGTTIASLVQTDGTWIEANFKETQLATIKAGQPAEVSVDAYAGKLKGTVESIGAATGAEFSLIPAQNATGNWVKVVQRIPVRIELASGTDLAALKTGMSATVSVDTGHSELDELTGH